MAIIKISNKNSDPNIQQSSPHLQPLKFIIGFTIILFFFRGIVPVTAQEKSTIIPVTVTKSGDFGDGHSSVTSISEDGRFITLISQARNLVSVSGSTRLLMYDRLTQNFIQIADSVISAESSSDGRIIFFSTSGSKSGFFIFDSLTSKTRSLHRPIWMEVDQPLRINSVTHDGRLSLISSFSGKSLKDITAQASTTISLYDRVTDFHKKIIVPETTLLNQSNSRLITISDDGSTIVFLGFTDKATSEKSPREITIYNRVLDNVTTVKPDTSFTRIESEIVDLAVSGNGDIITYILSEKIGDGTTYRVMVYDLTKGTTRELTKFNSDSADLEISSSLSNKGEYLAIRYGSDPSQILLSRFSLNNGKELILDQGDISGPIEITGDGSQILYAKIVTGISQIFLWNENPQPAPAYIVAGRVIDKVGTPLGLVTLVDQNGHLYRSDWDGYFWINGIDPGTLSLIPSKRGFIFNPQSIDLYVDSDIRSLNIISEHIGVLEEGAEDLGMPYSKFRGNTGLFHGYSAGDCTDLILDAYTWGADFNIQLAVEMDFKTNPDHFYRWRNARDAHDMWRYFSYTGQMHTHTEPYQPGDIVFFDWDGDGEIDHVALVSKVDRNFRPMMMYDAAGVTNNNPSGLASELPWEYFHETTVRGFARWSGLNEPFLQDLPLGDHFQFAISGESLEIRLLDFAGNAISRNESEVYGGRYHDLIWEQSISVLDLPRGNTPFIILVKNRNTAPQAYHFTAQRIHNGLVTNRIENEGLLEPGETIRLAISLELVKNGNPTMRLFNRTRWIEEDIILY